MRTAGRMLATLFIRVPAVDCVGTEAGNGVQRCGEDRGEPRLIRHAKKKQQVSAALKTTLILRLDPWRFVQ